jgi:outer membrane protein
MKRLLALILTLASGFVLSAAAQTSPDPAAAAAPAGPAKVAVIAFQTAVGQTNEFQRDFADLQKKYEPKREQLKTMADEIDNLDKQLQAQGDKLSDAERLNRTKTIEDKKKQAERFQEDAQNDLQGEMQETYNSVATKVFDVLASYSQQQGFTLVLDSTPGQQQAPVVLYASGSTDITKAIIDAYNVKSGVPAPPAQPAAAAPRTAPSTAKPAATP